MIESLNWKVIAISAAVAFVLSCLTGLISGIMFGVLLLRASVVAVLFGVAGGAVSLLIARFLPELLGQGEPDQTAFEQDEIGQQVDIMSEPLETEAFADESPVSETPRAETPRAEALQTEPRMAEGEPPESESATEQAGPSPMVDNEVLQQSGVQSDYFEDKEALVSAVQTMLREDEMRGR